MTLILLVDLTAKYSGTFELEVSGHPGRTFLGKRRYFSGIAALTPLTPLTPLYRQKNAVNDFIPTGNTVNAVIPEKTCVYKKLIFSLHEE